MHLTVLAGHQWLVHLAYMRVCLTKRGYTVCACGAYTLSWEEGESDA